MRKIGFILTVFVFATISLAVGAQVKNKTSEKRTLADYFLIEKNKPSVYITFEKSGTAEPLYKGEGRKRFWLRLFNNTKGEISFCSFKVAQPYGDIGIVYDLEESNHFGSEMGEESIPEVKAKKDSKTESSKVNQEKKRELSLEENKISQGYTTGDVCYTFYLQSGKSVLFSIPTEHLIVGKRTFYIETKFKYEWEEEGTEIAGQPSHIVSFSFGSLPFSERKGL